METPIESTELTVPSLKDTDTRNKIRTLYMDGKEVKEILDIMNIPKGTWDNCYYLNHNAFRDFMNELKKEYVLRTVEDFSKDLMAMKVEDNAKMKAIQQKEAEFVRETLLKEHGYTKRVETIGLNLNKSEPLDVEQKAKLDKLLKVSSNMNTKNSEIIDIEAQQSPIK